MSGPQSQQRYSDEELLNHLRELANNGVAPSRAEINEADGPNARQYDTYLGGLPNARREAGLCDPPGSHSGKNISKEDCLDWIDSFVEYYGVPPSSRDLRSWPGPSGTVYRRLFGSVSTAVREAGYEPRGDADD